MFHSESWIHLNCLFNFDLTLVMSTEDKRGQTEIGLGVGVLGKSCRDRWEQIDRKINITV